MRLVTSICCNSEIIYLKYLIPVVAKFSDEVLVVNESKNEELEKICSSFENVRFVVFDRSSGIKKYTFCLSLVKDGDWFFRVDSDEIPTYALSENIRGMIEENEKEIDRMLVHIFHLDSLVTCKEEIGVELRLFQKNSSCVYLGDSHEYIHGDFPLTGSALPYSMALVHFKFLDREKINEAFRRAKLGLGYDEEDLKRRVYMKRMPLPKTIKFPLGEDLFEKFK